MIDSNVTYYMFDLKHIYMLIFIELLLNNICHNLNMRYMLVSNVLKRGYIHYMLYSAKDLPKK